MRASELLGSAVVGPNGEDIGQVRDVRVRRLSSGTFRILGIVVTRGRLGAVAHAWGFVDGRGAGPWLLRKLLARAARRSRYVPAAHVDDWKPGLVRVARGADELEPVRRAR